MKNPIVGWSDFSFEKDRWKFKGTAAGLLKLVHKNWKNRVPGVGRTDLTKVVVVPIKEVNLFKCNWLDINSAKRITGKVVRRQPFEDPYVALIGRGVSEAVKCAKVVLYSADTLLEDGGTRTHLNADWEVVAVLTGPWENEPMTPLTMARNFLRKPGGTFAPYTAEQFAESIYFWSQFIQNR